MEGEHILDAPAPAPMEPENYVYSGVWPRIAASLIDVLIILPVTLLITYLNYTNLNNYYYTGILGVAAAAAYHIYFLSQNGATPGKRAMNLKVICIDGSDVTVRVAFLRHLPVLVIGVLTFLMTYMMLQTADADTYGSLNWMSRMQYLASQNTALMSIPTWLNNIWFITSFIVLLVNTYNRTLHDFIAQTVVIKTQN